MVPIPTDLARRLIAVLGSVEKAMLALVLRRGAIFALEDPDARRG
jgi:hypothetical protein